MKKLLDKELSAEDLKVAAAKAKNDPSAQMMVASSRGDKKVDVRSSKMRFDYDALPKTYRDSGPRYQEMIGRTVLAEWKLSVT